MTEVWSQSWFWPAVSVIIGLPIVLLVLSEVYEYLRRVDHPAARIVRLLRTVVAPVAALLILLSQTSDVDVDANWTRIVATVLGFLLIVVLINGLNVALFVSARKGSWRDRLPSIFLDVTRFLLIVISLALLFSWVWGADVGGLFTALGIGSIVIGLALQNAVGSVLSGLLLLFEQPFQLGDWLDHGGVRGQVEEVNWRSVHIRTIRGVQVVPNAELAGSSFTNLSRKGRPYSACETVTFATEDPPHRVIAVMETVAADLPYLAPGATPSATALGAAQYEITLPLPSPGLHYDAAVEFHRVLWYAARRAGLHLDRDYFDDYNTAARRREHLLRACSVLHCSVEQVDALVDRVSAERYTQGEKLQHVGEVPEGIRIIMAGLARMIVETGDGARLPVIELQRDELVGLTSLTRQGINASVQAVTEVEALLVPVAVLDELVAARPELARDIGREIDNRRRLVVDAFTAAGLVLPLSSRAIAY